MRVRLGLACLLLAALPGTVGAQTSDAATQAELIKSLAARIEQLEKRIAELEAPGTLTRTSTNVTREVPAAAAAPLSPRAAIEAIHGEHGDPAGTDVQEYPSLKLAGFTDLNFSGTNQPGAKSGFTEGQFILHLNSALSRKVNFFGEMSFTARPDAGTGAPAVTGFNAEVERSIVRLDYNDYFKLSFGRYHTPINYWNTAYHHGQWLQTTVSRPEMIQFGGRLLPVHFVGALVEGAVPASGLNLNYNFGVGNGRGNVISRGGDAGDNNNNRAWLINTFVKPDALFGLQIGGSVYRDKVTPAAGLDFHEWITSAHVVWSKEDPEVIAEFANVRHTQFDRPSVVSNSQAWYTQVGYRLPLGPRLWKPYYRFEYIHIPRSDSVFRGIPTLAGSVVGLRYDLSTFTAIKFEYRSQRRAPGQPQINSGFVQTSFTF